MKYNQEKIIKINETYDIETFIEIVADIKFYLKWQQIELEELEQKEIELNEKSKGPFRTVVVPLLMAFGILTGIVVPIIIGVLTGSAWGAIISLIVIASLIVFLLMGLDKYDLKQKNTLENKRSAIKTDIQQVITPQLAYVLHLTVDFTDTNLTAADIEYAHAESQALTNIIRMLDIYYNAKTIFSIDPYDAQQLIKDSLTHTKSILFKNKHNTLCLFVVDKHQRHYYEFNEETNVFDYIEDTLKFTK